MIVDFMDKAMSSSTSLKTTRGYRVMRNRAANKFLFSVAKGLSRVFHPFIVSVVTLLLGQVLAGFSVWTATLWTIVSFAIVIAPTLIVILVKVRQGRYENVDVSVREDRFVLYVLGGSCMIFTIVLQIIFQAPVIVQKIVQAGFLSSLVGSLVNKFVNKISLHVLTMAGCTVVLFFLSPPIGSGLGILSVFVVWSRMYLARHTFVEVFWGWLVGAGCSGAWWLISQNFYPAS
jgi:membrane-associated phospholipid phosphatase